LFHVSQDARRGQSKARWSHCQFRTTPTARQGGVSVTGSDLGSYHLVRDQVKMLSPTIGKQTTTNDDSQDHRREDVVRRSKMIAEILRIWNKAASGKPEADWSPRVKPHAQAMAIFDCPSDRLVIEF
jgi:hypothetical protein